MKSKTAIRKSLKEILTALNYDDELGASIDMALLSASARLAEYNRECQKFIEKYQSSYEEMEIKAREGEEDFKLEDDLMAWKFAEEGKSFWEEKIRKLKEICQPYYSKNL